MIFILIKWGKFWATTELVFCIEYLVFGIKKVLLGVTTLGSFGIYLIGVIRADGAMVAYFHGMEGVESSNLFRSTFCKKDFGRGWQI